MDWISVKDKAPEFPCVVYDGENYPKVVTELLKIEADGETVYFEGEMSNWIENLKVGDYVFVCWRMGTSLRKVEKITPKGNIKVNGIMFNKDGSQRGGDDWSKCYLSEATPEAIKSFQDEITIKKAIKIMREIKSISLEQAKKIIELLGTPQNDEVRE